MKATIDAAGRVVIPKKIREAANLSPGTILEVALVEGLIELKPASEPVRLERRDGLLVAVSDDAERLEQTTVDEAIDELRAGRSSHSERRGGAGRPE